MEGKINYALYTNIHLILLSTKALASPSNSLVMCRYCLFGTKKEHGVLGLAIFIPYIFHIYGYIPKSWTQLSDWTELTEYDLIDNSLIIIESLLRVVAKDLWSRLISWVWILASPLTSFTYFLYWPVDQPWSSFFISPGLNFLICKMINQWRPSHLLEDLLANLYDKWPWRALSGLRPLFIAVVPAYASAWAHVLHKLRKQLWFIEWMLTSFVAHSVNSLFKSLLEKSLIQFQIYIFQWKSGSQGKIWFMIHSREKIDFSYQGVSCQNTSKFRIF